MPTERLPWMKWYWQDHWGNPKVRVLSKLARLAWMDLVGLIFMEGDGGVLEISKADLAIHWSSSAKEVDGLLRELADKSVGDFEIGAIHVRVVCRRIARDRVRHDKERQRKADYRERKKGQDVVVPVGHDRRVPATQRPEARVQNPEARGQRPEVKKQTTEEPPCRAEPRRQEVEADLVFEVITHYRTYHPRAIPKPTAKSKEVKLIRARLKEGFSVADLVAAIDGCHRDPYHCGSNEQGKKYQSLALIFRDGSKVSDLMEAGGQNGTAPERPLTKANQITMNTLRMMSGDGK